MTAPAVVPIVLKDVTLKVGADNYEAHVSSVEFVPTSGTVPWKGLTPSSVFNFATKATWQCNLAFAQDWETPNSLSAYLFDNEGEIVVADFYPEAGGTGFRATLNIVPGSIGGAVDSVAVATVTLGVQGRPARIVAP